MKSTLVTNAMRFGSDDFWAQYQLSPNTGLGISIKAHDETSLQRVALVTTFNKVELGVRRGLSLRQGGVSVVLGANTEPRYMIHMAQFAMDCGAKMFSLSPCTPSFVDGKPDGASVMHPNDFVRYVVGAYPEIERITQGRFSISIKTPLCLWPRDFMEMLIEKRQLNTVCQLHKHAGIIFGVDGSALICNSLFEYPVGKLGVDFNDAESLVALLNSEKTLSLYKPLTSYASSKCINCPKHSQCAAGCPLFWTLYDPKELIPGWRD
jgi:radical SAM protein with 4Fe4S-binding SPASM domain